MPVALPIIIGIAAAATGATELGLQLSGAGQPSTSGALKQEQQAQAAQAKADQEAKQKAILASLPNAQEQGGGALNTPSLTDLASVIAGFPGEANSTAGRGALSSFLGTPSSNPGGSSDNLVNSTYGLSGSQG